MTYLGSRNKSQTLPISTKPLIPIFPDDIANHAMIFVLLETADSDGGDNSIETLNANRDASSMNSVVGILLRADAKLCAKGWLVAIVPTVEEPAASAEAQDAVSFPGNPSLVVGSGARADDALEQNLVAVRGGDGDDGGASLLRIRKQSSVEQVPKFQGVLGSEGSQSEGITFRLNSGNLPT